MTGKAGYHLPGLFEFYEFYRVFLPLYRERRECFYPWCEIASIYGAPAGCLWGGGRTSGGDADPADVLKLMREYGIAAGLTLSNSLLKKEDLADHRANALCSLFEKEGARPTGVILHSDLLLHYLKMNYPDLYFISSTTKVLEDFPDLERELAREDFHYVVADFRLNKDFEHLSKLPEAQKEKLEFLCNECCALSCRERYRCYENVSRKNLGEDCEEHICAAPEGEQGYRFSKAMESPAFISTEEILNRYLPMGFSQFKIEGRGLGSAVLLEILLYYMVKPEHRLRMREEIYLDSMLDLF